MPDGVSAQLIPSGALKTEPFQEPKILKITKRVGALTRLVLTMFATLLPARASPVSIKPPSLSVSFSPVSAEVSTSFSTSAKLTFESWVLGADENGAKKEEKKSALGKIRSPSQPPKLLKAKSR